MAEGDLLPIGAAAEVLGVSVRTLRGAAERGVVSVELTEGGHRRFDRRRLLTEWRAANPTWLAPPMSHELFDRQYPLAGLAEDRVWRDVAAVLPELPPNVRQIIGYAVTEMVNNAIDHSNGSRVSVSASVDESRDLIFLIEDDGVGAFDTLMRALDLPDRFAAIQELSKGKRTSAPDRHTGEGIFFSSKAVDRFSLDANGLRWVVDNVREDSAVGAGEIGRGSAVRLEIAMDSARSLTALFEEFTDDFAFVRTRPTVKLFELGTEFVSRSEAKRLAQGLEKFSAVELDFHGVDLVGQGFVDELFRVWAAEHPATELIPVRASPAVDFMIRRGLGAHR